jgi:hypothetical protein
MDQASALANLFRILEHAKARPAMYFGRDEPDLAFLYLAGFSTAAGAALGWNLERRFEIREAAVTSRGWRYMANGPVYQMNAKGWSASQIVAELIEIEAEYIRRMTQLVADRSG